MRQILRQATHVLLWVSLSLSAQLLNAQWSTMNIDTRYVHWNEENPPPGTPPNPQPSPIRLSPDFIQYIGDPHIQITDSLDWLIMGFGSHGYNNRPDIPYCGDRNYIITRRNAGGAYAIPNAPVLYYPNPCTQPPGNLGVGPGIAKTPISTSGGYKYFALVPAGNPVPTGNPPMSHMWLTWAVSADGTSWAFPKDPAGTLGTTSDPSLSLHLIRRSDLVAVNPSGVLRINHVALVYNKYDGFFYIVFGWAGDTNGIHATWWRIQFDASETFGLHKDTQGRYDVQVKSTGSYVVTGGGIIPPNDNWVNGALDPLPADGAMQAVDPMDLVQLDNQQGGFDSMVFLYEPLRGRINTPAQIAYVKGILNGTSGGNFGWQAPQTLDLGIVYGDGVYASSCKRQAPNSLGVVAYPGVFQADGSPQLYGFVTVQRGSPPAVPYGNEVWGGLLPVRFALNTGPRLSWVTAPSFPGQLYEWTSGPAAAATPVTLTGTGFTNGTTVSVGGVAATNVVFTNSNTITATTPALGAGQADVSVTVPGKPTATLANGYFYDFLDVPPSGATQPYHPYVVRLSRNGVTSGCGGNNYCPTLNIPREQMAVFLLKGAHGATFAPPACTTPIFVDVPCSSPYAAWEEEVYNEGIMASCSPGHFCPSDLVTRGDMAVFLLKAEHGSGWTPPACSLPPNQVFGDVTCPGPQTDWIEYLWRENIAAGCGPAAGYPGGNYCPTSPNTREQMAAFITKTFCLD